MFVHLIRVEEFLLIDFMALLTSYFADNRKHEFIRLAHCYR